MSEDNGIYIGKFKNGYKVIHASAIDDLVYHHNSRNEGFNWASVCDYYKRKELLTKEQAENEAFKMLNNEDYVEYGIQIIDFSQYNWNDIIKMAKKKAEEELPYFKSKGWKSLVEFYEAILLLD